MAVANRRPRKQTPEVKQDMNLVKLVNDFHSEEACHDYLEQLRWPNGLACLRCGSMSVSRYQLRRRRLEPPETVDYWVFSSCECQTPECLPR